MTTRYGFYCAALLLCLGLLLPHLASADSLRCKNRLVSIGDGTHDVRSLCGLPDATQQRIEKRSVMRQVRVPCAQPGPSYCIAAVQDTIEVTVEVWTYDFGPQRFLQYLTFEQGTLIRMQSGDYGYKQL